MTEWHPLRSLEGNDSELSRMWSQLDKSAETVGRTIAATSPATMPTLDHSSMADYYNVYEPSDDTYLLIDAIKHELFTEHPSETNTGDKNIGPAESTSNEKDKEAKDISRAALKWYYRGSRTKPESDEENTILENQIIQRLLENDNGFSVDELRKQFSRQKSGTDEGNEIPGDNQIFQELLDKERFSDDQLKKVLLRLQQLKRLEEIQTVMEIGTGSGVPITYLAKRLLEEKPKQRPQSNSKKGISVIATDLNPLALEFARKTASENGVTASDESSYDNATIESIEFIECDLATPLLDDRQGTIDVLIFNPPYVPTDDSEVSGNGIEISWAGGKDGRLVVDRALPQIARLLKKPSGVCYMITVDDNLPSELATILKEKHGLHMVPLVRRRARNEYLSVQKISWMAQS